MSTDNETENPNPDISPIAEDDVPEIEAICGVIITMSIDGQGINIMPIPNEQGRFERMATMDDVLMLVTAANAHIQGNLAGLKAVNLLEQIKAQGKTNRIVKAGLGRG